MSKFLKLLKNVIPLGLGLYLVYYSFENTTEEARVQIITAIKQADLWFVFLSLVLGALSHLSRAHRWYYLLSPLGYRPSFVMRTLTVMISYFSNLGIPRSGEVLRATALTTYAGVPFEKSFGTIVTERIIDLVLLFSLIGLGFVLQGPLLLEAIGNPTLKLNSFFWLLLALALLLAGIGFLRRSQHPIALKILHFISGLWQGLLSIKKLEKKGLFLGHTLFIWMMYLLMFWVMTFAIPQTSTISFSAMLLAFIAGGFAMTATNGGIGLYPIAVAAVLQTFDIPYPQALAFGWLMWTTQTAMVVLFGSISFLLLPILSKK